MIPSWKTNDELHHRILHPIQKSNQWKDTQEVNGQEDAFNRIC